MRKHSPWLLGVAALVVFAFSLVSQSQEAQHFAPPMAGIHWARGQAPAHARTTSSPNLIYHGGPVMHGTLVEPIFWGDWSSPGDKVTGVQTFYSTVGGTSYADTNTEYTDANGNVSDSVVFVANHFDSSTPANGNNTGGILGEVCKVITNPSENGYYPVYTDTPRGGQRFCAWHSAGSCNGVVVQFAFFFKLDGDPGCDPEDPRTVWSQGMEALANVSGHEMSEMLTDRHLNAWYDSSGEENSDKCAWTFGTQPLKFTRTSTWKIQGNWSNAAYDSNQGYVDPSTGSKVRGCIDGTN